MGFSMTAPMVWWMHWRGHSWGANRAMALAMSLPTVAMLACLATGMITDLDTLFAIEHIAMFPARRRRIPCGGGARNSRRSRPLRASGRRRARRA